MAPASAPVAQAAPSPILLALAALLYLATALAIIFVIVRQRRDSIDRSPRFQAKWRRDDRFWIAVALLLMVAALYRATGLEYQLQGVMREALLVDNLYAVRRDLQTPVVLGGMVLGFALLGLADWRLRQRHPSVRLAAAGSLALLMLIAVRAVSAHGLDALLQASVARIKLGWLIEAGLLIWLVGCLLWFRRWRADMARKDGGETPAPADVGEGKRRRRRTRP